MCNYLPRKLKRITCELLKLILNKVTGYKINKQNQMACLYASVKEKVNQTKQAKAKCIVMVVVVVVRETTL